MIALALSGALFCSAWSEAALLTFNGSFTATTFTDNPAGGNALSMTPNPLTVSWEMTFDDSAVTGAGAEIFTTAHPKLNWTTFSLTGGFIGTTAYNTANALAEIIYVGGVLQNQILLFGAPGGTTIAGSTDDFYISYQNTSTTDQPRLTNSGQAQIAYSQTYSGSYTVVPEPSLTLMGMAGMLLMLRRRR